ncbi:MAG: hypothetical protein AMQ74_01692 [Candidatus Methanofastidiosum methylothiophilum]|uniref:Uncharacterized protein n=1 Tax=Candidatus Methanofastidiosum methylothiophilum TaxID=1705564 RepID=A0A150IR25_9EURY|nr:MAG: hypothetical protein AMQ74_01692 [Candidatus Methanofastidiosum methylthiophilus]
MKKTNLKVVQSRVSRLAKSEQKQLPDGYPFKSNSIILLNHFLATGIAGKFLDAPVSYIIALVFSWSIVILGYTQIAERSKTVRKNYLVGTLVVIMVSYLVYCYNSAWAYRIPIDNIVFLKSFIGYVVIYYFVLSSMALLNMKRTGFINFMNGDKWKAIGVLFASILIHLGFIYVVVV